MTDEALNLARSALAIDRESLPALLVIGLAQFHSLVLRTATDRAQAWQEAMQAVTQAIALTQSGLTYAVKALLLMQKPDGGGLNEARIAGEMAYALNPSDSYAIIAHALTLVAEDPTKAAELLAACVAHQPAWCIGVLDLLRTRASAPDRTGLLRRVRVGATRAECRARVRPRAIW